MYGLCVFFFLISSLSSLYIHWVIDVPIGNIGQYTFTSLRLYTWKPVHYIKTWAFMWYLFTHLLLLMFFFFTSLHSVLVSYSCRFSFLLNGHTLWSNTYECTKRTFVHKCMRLTFIADRFMLCLHIARKLFFDVNLHDGWLENGMKKKIEI